MGVSWLFKFTLLSKIIPQKSTSIERNMLSMPMEVHNIRPLLSDSMTLRQLRTKVVLQTSRIRGLVNPAQGSLRQIGFGLCSFRKVCYLN